MEDLNLNELNEVNGGLQTIPERVIEAIQRIIDLILQKED